LANACFTTQVFGAMEGGILQVIDASFSDSSYYAHTGNRFLIGNMMQWFLGNNAISQE
jgi:hypothetical protein